MKHTSGGGLPDLTDNSDTRGNQTMDNVERLSEKECRIGIIFWLDSITATPDTPCSSFDEFMMELDDPESEICLQLPELVQFTNDEHDIFDAPYVLQGRKGFIFQASTPVRKYHTEIYSSYSWGYTWQEWLYAENEDAIADVALAWAAKKRAFDLAQSHVGGCNDD